MGCKQENESTESNLPKPCCATLTVNLRLSMEVIYVTIGNPTFCLVLYLTGVHFRGKLQYISHLSEQKIKCRPIKIREIVGVRL